MPFVEPCMIYDIATKRLVQLDPKAFLSLILERPVSSCEELTELPQELPTLNRVDQVWWSKFTDEERCIVLLEFVSHWDKKKKLDMAIYDLLLTRKYDVEVLSVAILCLPNQRADAIYQKNNCVFRFKLVKMWEQEAAEVFQSGHLTLYPLLPLMKGGAELAETAGKELLKSGLQREVKADLLAMLGIFLGLTDHDKAASLIWKRSQLMDILAESPFYQWIQNQGLERGLERGREEGREEGRKEGRREGRVQGLKEAVKLGLHLRFSHEAASLFPKVDACDQIILLESAEAALRDGKSLKTIAQIFG